MRADLPALLILHDVLEQRPEHGGTDLLPVKIAARQERRAHGGVEVGEVQPLAEQFPVDVGQRGQMLVQIALTFAFGRIEHFKKVPDLGAGVRPILARPVKNKILERIRFENVRVLREQTKEDSHHEPFEIMAGESPFPEPVVQVGQKVGRVDVRRIFGVEPPCVIPRDEREMPDLGRKL